MRAGASSPVRVRPPAGHGHSKRASAPGLERHGYYLDAARTGTRWLYDVTRLPDDMFQDRGPNGADLLVPSKAADDVRALGDLLRDAYGRYDKYAHNGLDVPGLIERHAQRLEQGKPVTALQAFVPLIGDLRAGLSDNHLQLGLEGASQFLNNDSRLIVREFRGPVGQLAAASAVAGAAAVTAAVLPQLAAAGTKSSIGSISIKGSASDSTLAKLGYSPVSTLAPDTTLLPRSDKYYSFTVEGDTGVIRLPNFSDGEDTVSAALRAFVADAPKHREMANLVLDLRGNRGGNDGYVYEWAKKMRSRDRTLPEFSRVAFPSGKTAAIAAWNLGAYVEKYIPEIPGAGAVIADGKATQRLWPLHDSLPNLPDVPSAEHGEVDSDWPGKLLVLVDRRNSSSGESAALALSRMMDAKIVGERTHGSLEGTNVMFFDLPATGLVVGVPSRRTEYFDKRIGEGIGVPIDVALAAPGMPAIDIARQLIGSKFDS